MPFTENIESSCQDYYLNAYLKHYQQPGFGVALATIPSMMMVDDHDIFDGIATHCKIGFGSYDDALQQSPIFQGIGRVARRFYLIFQHKFYTCLLTS